MMIEVNDIIIIALTIGIAIATTRIVITKVTITKIAITRNRIALITITIDAKGQKDIIEAEVIVENEEGRVMVKDGDDKVFIVCPRSFSVSLSTPIHLYSGRCGNSPSTHRWIHELQSYKSHSAQ